MTTEQIKAIQTKIGTVPDGVWGPKSKAACKAYLRSLMPSPNPWPRNSQAALRAFYGEPGDESNLTPINVTGLGIKYEGKPVTSIRCHKKVAASLLAALKEVSSTSPDVLTRYAGCFNFRKKRGGSTYSEHAWGIAVDIDPDTNMLNTPWPTVATMPFEVMEAFARQGWGAAGAFWGDPKPTGRDAMHFSAVVS